MCGIVAYVGNKDVRPVLIEGLKRLEYRGYDSSGICIGGKEGFFIRKAAGRISVLESILDEEKAICASHVGMAHTRWATHGAPTEINAHPHLDDKKKIAIVHNGIIENYSAIRQFLAAKGHSFVSDTDTESLAVLIGHFYDGHLAKAVQLALREVRGTYGLAVMAAAEPDTLVVARRGSPLIIGVGKDEYIVASDAAAVVEHTTQVIYLNDNEMAVITPKAFRTTTIDDVPVAKDITAVEFSLEQIELGGYEHFMLK